MTVPVTASALSVSTPALAALLPLAVAIPLTGAVLAPLLARWTNKAALGGCLVTMACSLAVLILAAPRVFGGRILVHYLGGWRPSGGTVLGIAFAADPFGLLIALVVAGVGLLLLLYTLSELGGLGARECGGFACLFQLLLSALIGAALTGDLFDLFVWFQVAALSSYGLTGFFLERPIALEAAFKILVLTTMAGFTVFLGAGLLYAHTGALNLGQLHVRLAAPAGVLDAVALGLLIAGFATKAALLPFHGWLADAHTAAPGPVSALFSGLMVILGLIGISRLALQVFPGSGLPVLGALMVLGLATAVCGAALALAQDDFKRVLAYDTVSQMGVITVGFATGNAAGVTGAVYHLVNHALFKALLFLCAGAVVHRTGQTSLRALGGLAKRFPAVTVAFTVGAASIAGIPPFNGYVSLSLIHEGLTSSHQDVPYAVMLLAQLLTVAALGRAAWLAFYRPAEHAEDLDAPLQPHESLRTGMAAGLIGLGGCCVAFGVFPQQILRMLMEPAAGGLLEAARYSAAQLRVGAAGGSVVPAHVSFEYANWVEILVTVVTLLVAAAGVRWYLRLRRDPQPISGLRALHTGSANDYAAYAVVGLLALVAAFTGGMPGG
ncbi:Fe-S-binding domain-containing protein [Actinospica sp. MGRD01-02]|uniref:Fe-S-binding domain-containing protein n=1 Tax=Actinospica acidithermotolerans TaxID=2828514 RepID=A0A941ECT7_9ACTN|nr:proton-conducting transporter membrane subunit [Actinospica acidithermotolerans]MBR7828025.1 Fe-S-binding domain-containing protein [Actinospica acidithermotolerans]